MTYRLLDLFSGIGGFSLGLERTGGFKTVAFCEIAPSCRHLLNHHWPLVPCYDDINTLTGERLVADGISVDVLCGGFPCQDLSYAGKGAGLDGARSGLWFQIARLLRELRDLGRPVRIVALENVSALLGRGLGIVLGDLAALGFDAEWDCIPASAVGAPHRRDRVWIVAYARGEQHEGFGDAFRRALAAGLSEAAVADSGCECREPGRASGNMAGATRSGEGQGHQRERHGDAPNDCGSDVAHARQSRLQEPEQEAIFGEGGRQEGRAASKCGWWAVEPDVGRVAHGVPARVDRLHGLGNAVVPQIPEIIGRAILDAAGWRPGLPSQTTEEGPQWPLTSSRTLSQERREPRKRPGRSEGSESSSPLFDAASYERRTRGPALPSCSLRGLVQGFLGLAPGLKRCGFLFGRSPAADDFPADVAKLVPGVGLGFAEGGLVFRFHERILHAHISTSIRHFAKARAA